MLLLDAGLSYREICNAAFASTGLIADFKAKFLAGGVDAALAGGT